MNAETIKDFLVSLGFQVDQSGQHKFEQTLASVTLKAAAMATAVEATALSVVAFTAKIASGLDNLYWASQRTGATVAGIQAIGYAASQVGGSVEGARSSLESLARFMRNNPGSEGFLNRLGVQTRDARGHMMDMSSIFTGVGQRLSQMPYYRANQFAQMLGIDENTLMAMRRGMGTFSAQYSQMAKAIGYNADTAARQSNVFMTSLRSFGLMAGMARDKIGSTLAGGLAGSIDHLRRQVVDNFPKIEGAITTGANGILWLANILTRVVFRLIESVGAVLRWWNSLDSGTRRVIEAVAALAVAWRALNSAFLASPIGRIIALGSAIALLFEDYKTWKEGGQSLIDWQKWKPQIDSAVKGIKTLESSILKLFGIDPKKWTGEWDFSNLTQNLGDFGKMLNYIAEMLNAIKDGRWGDAYAAGKALLNQHSDTTTDALPGVSSSADSAADWIQSKTGFDPRSIGRFFTGNRPDRNNNPGNLTGSGGFRVFSDAASGWDAMRNQLMRYFTGKTTGRHLQTISDIVSTWAPPGENNTPAYIAAVSKWMNVSPNAALNLNNPDTMANLMQSMARQEGYSQWNSPVARQVAGAQVQQQNTYHIYGGNAQEIGQEVGRRQIDANAKVLRTNQSGVG
ncbi:MULTISPECIES: hypothetical protein [unclassified Tatumella]|uniref:hypothetical protein n=1 Tax=unclassified Tatumella TaxID=2649542 RepID=UPI001BAF6010|nr:MULTISPECIES: hypothetical protein [unclassified Tatumella]MBS0877994.1 hypothetical protein [Tatumella sp. JGM82]MBS0891283.1 hypothetical protein [Tatumella sp. JGM94]MBS0902662.1 hypothetical protein [Tatumella sp. JGM100]